MHTTQHNTAQHNTMHYTICFLRNLNSPGVKTVLNIERYTQRLTRGLFIYLSNLFVLSSKFNYQRILMKFHLLALALQMYLKGVLQG